MRGAPPSCPLNPSVPLGEGVPSRTKEVVRRKQPILTKSYFRKFNKQPMSETMASQKLLFTEK